MHITVGGGKIKLVGATSGRPRDAEFVKRTRMTAPTKMDLHPPPPSWDGGRLRETSAVL